MITETLLLENADLKDFTFTKNSNKSIDGVDDKADFKSLTVSWKNIYLDEKKRKISEIYDKNIII